MRTTIVRRASAGLLAAALLGGAAACGSHSEHAPPPAASAGHNSQDAMFAQMMVPHHQQAITMSEHELAAGADPAVKDLAATIQRAQAPEIQQMRGWLAAWRAPATAEHHHGAGVMAPEQMDAFQNASGPGADRAFLEMMIEHHRGAVDMARTEQQAGKDPGAKQLATSILESQQNQIAQMQRMLGR